MSGNTYYLKSGARVLGPFTRDQLKSLEARGRLKSDHLISTDRQQWKSAESVLHGEETFPVETIPVETLPALPERGDWHYTAGDVQRGPVTAEELEAVMQSGRIQDHDLAWQPGMSQWESIAAVRSRLSGTTLPPMHRSSKLADSENHFESSRFQFCSSCGLKQHASAEYCARCQSPLSTPHASRHAASNPKAAGERKDKFTVALLALLLGGLGVHRFYLGQPVLGLLYLLFCWTLIPAFIAFVDAIVFLSMSQATFDASYNT